MIPVKSGAAAGDRNSEIQTLLSEIGSLCDASREATPECRRNFVEWKNLVDDEHTQRPET